MLAPRAKGSRQLCSCSFHLLPLVVPIGEFPTDAVECLRGKEFDSVSKALTGGGGFRNFLDGQERSEEGNSSLGSKLQSLENCWRKYVWGQIFFGNRAVTGKL